MLGLGKLLKERVWLREVIAVRGVELAVHRCVKARNPTEERELQRVL